MAQWVQDLALSWLWQGFDLWPRNFCKPKKKKGTVFPVLLGVARIGEGVSVRGGLDQGPVFAAAIRPPKGSTCL